MDHACTDQKSHGVEREKRFLYLQKLKGLKHKTGKADSQVAFSLFSGIFPGNIHRIYCRHHIKQNLKSENNKSPLLFNIFMILIKRKNKMEKSVGHERGNAYKKHRPNGIVKHFAFCSPFIKISNDIMHPSQHRKKHKYEIEYCCGIQKWEDSPRIIKIV